MKGTVSPEVSGICQVLRQHLRARGISQDELSKSLRVSLPTVKRWLQGKGLDLERLMQIVRFLELDIASIVSASTKITSEMFEYTLEQERAFTDDLRLLSFFDSLLQGNSVMGARKETEITEIKSRQYLRTLEKIKLIELHPRDRVRLLVRGEPQWSASGPLLTRFRQKGILEFTKRNLNDRKRIRFGIYRLYPEDKRELVLLLEKAYTFARTAEIRGRVTRGNKEMTGLLVGLSQFEWDMLGARS